MLALRRGYEYLPDHTMSCPVAARLVGEDRSLTGFVCVLDFRFTGGSQSVQTVRLALSEEIPQGKVAASG